jgi:hypothetical protein
VIRWARTISTVKSKQTRKDRDRILLLTIDIF